MESIETMNPEIEHYILHFPLKIHVHLMQSMFNSTSEISIVFNIIRIALVKGSQKSFIT